MHFVNTLARMKESIIIITYHYYYWVRIIVAEYITFVPTGFRFRSGNLVKAPTCLGSIEAYCRRIHRAWLRSRVTLR